MSRIRTIAFLGVAGLLVAGAAVHNVGTAATEDDLLYGGRILERAGYDAGSGAFGDPTRFETQIAATLAVQDAVLRATPLAEGLPLNQPREPKDILFGGQGLCYDRSRAIEKILTGLGFEVRHLAIYSTREHGRLRALMTPGVDSHALTEVKTEKGWMLVDSNARWIGLDAEGRVYAAEDIQGRNPFAMAWAPEVPEQISWPRFDGPFTYVIGLFSRHGGFFPPYTPVPDVNYAQLLYNIY